MNANKVCLQLLPGVISNADFKNKDWMIPSLKTPGLSGPQLRVFPHSADLAMNDAARAMSESADKVSSKVRVEAQSIGVKHEALAKGDLTRDEPSLPFDIDVQGAYSLGGVADLLSGGSLPVSMAAIEANENTDDEAREAAILMENIETDRIPCPRLCGAVFGPGAAGLTVFNNGDVRKMWRWWEKTDPFRTGSVGGIPAGPEIEVEAGENGSAAIVKLPLARDCPRSLKDLMEMTTAAKEAQWGEENDSDVSSAGLRALGENFFEGGSDASSDSEDDLLVEDSSTDAPKDLYDSYFGSSNRPLGPIIDISPSSHDTAEQRQRNERTEDYAPGPSSDMLAPFVTFTYQYDELSLNSQGPELAKALTLGTTWLDDMHDHVNAITATITESSSKSAAARSAMDMALSRNDAALMRESNRSLSPKRSKFLACYVDSLHPFCLNN